MNTFSHNIDKLSPLSKDELFAIILKQQEDIQILKDEIARLKNLPPRPKIKPSDLDKDTERELKNKEKGENSQKKGRKKKNLKNRVSKTQVIEATEVPEGSRKAGFSDYYVQDLVIAAEVIRLRRERWLTPDDKIIVADLPDWVDGEFGPNVKRFITALHYQCNASQRNIKELLNNLEIDISTGETSNILTKSNNDFCEEADNILKTGLEVSKYISTDDTGARHKGKSCYTTQIGNEFFTCFKTTNSKSRENFLRVLQAGNTEYFINKTATDYMKQKGLPDNLIAELSKEKSFSSQESWDKHLEKFELKPYRLRIVKEAGLIGNLSNFLENTVILSDGAGQFNIGIHALCWVHMERHVHKLICINDEQHRKKEEIREKIWDYYKKLKIYQKKPVEKEALIKEFDKIFNQKINFEALDEILEKIFKHKKELLIILDYPYVPLHTNDSERDIRSVITKRKISFGTWSDKGKQCRDSFLSIMKTFQKLDINFWQYLGSRLKTHDATKIEYIPDIIKMKAAI